MRTEIMSSGDARLAWLVCGELERAGIRTYLAIGEDDLFGDELYRVLIDGDQESKARAILDALPDDVREDEDGVLSFVTKGT